MFIRSDDDPKVCTKCELEKNNNVHFWALDLSYVSGSFTKWEESLIADCDHHTQSRPSETFEQGGSVEIVEVIVSRVIQSPLHNWRGV